MSKFQKPDWVLNREIPAGETKGEQNKRHTKERKDLELYIRQNRVPNKVGNEWLRDLAQSERLEKETEPELSVEEMLKDIDENAKLETKKREGELAGLNRRCELERAIEEYQENEMIDKKTGEMRTISEKLAASGLRRHQIPPDGNCLYSSLEYSMGIGDGLLRRELASFVSEHYDEHKEVISEEYSTLNEYIQHVEEDWGDELDIYLSSIMLGVQINVYNAFMDRIEYKPAPDLPQVNIVYSQFEIPGGAHYSATDVLP